MGASQSAFRLVAYVNAVHPLAGAYDGFLVHSRGAGGAPTQPSPGFTCEEPINTGQARYVLAAAFHRLDRWVADGIRPPVAPRLETVGENPVTFATDAHGNVLGGIRTPAVDAPVATLSGRSRGGSLFCFLFGSTEPFTPEELEELYPSHYRFVSSWARATWSALFRGFLVPADARELVAAAIRSDIGR